MSVVFAQEEARALKHNYIGTEHILLGLLREESAMAARALGSLGIAVDVVRDKVARIVGSGHEDTTGQIPFTPRAKKVLELALREALSLGHDYIGTEHILLGLVRENEGVASTSCSTSTPTPRRSATRSSACCQARAVARAQVGRRRANARNRADSLHIGGPERGRARRRGGPRAQA